VIIAHRLSTVMEADQILVIQGGQVVQHGRHAELSVVADSLYNRLCRLQGEGRLVVEMAS
jgi:ABC-type multidrug transport system fused ATPase/permease subunit